MNVGVIHTFEGAGASRRNNFDFIRLALAAAVLLSHAYMLARGNDDADIVYRLTRGREHVGALAVAGFFAISGFLIANSWARSRSLLDFALRRALRIYPGYIVALAVTVFVVGAHYQQDYAPGPAGNEFGRTLLTATCPSLPGIFASNPKPNQANGSLWTIRYELLCYLMVAALGLTGLLARRRAVLLAFGIAMAIYAAAERLEALNHPWGHLIFTGALYWTAIPRLFACFLAGTTFWAYRDRIPDSPWLAMACLVSLALSSSLGGFCVHMAVPLFFTYGLFWLAFRPSLPLAGFGRRGDFSYGTYLYAFPVSQMLIHWGAGHYGGHTVAAGTVLLTAPLAAASWYLVERPMLQLTGKGRAAPAAVQAATAVPKPSPVV